MCKCSIYIENIKNIENIEKKSDIFDIFENITIFSNPVFETALRGLGATYDDHLRLIGKRVVDFLLVLNELFSLGVMADALRANIGSKLAISLQRGLVDPKFQEEGFAPTNHSSSQKTRLNDLSYVINICTDLSSVLSQFTRLTDTQLSHRLCSTVKSRQI